MKEIPLDSDAPVQCPVLLMAFNRPEHTSRVWETVREARPRQLWVSLDGPREDVPSDRENGELVRKIVESVDWPCEVKRFYHEENAGCGKAVSSAIEWFLREAGEGIILEDDTVPTPTFFRFCEKMLELYRDDKSIASIGGVCFFPERIQRVFSRGESGDPILNLHLSRHNHTWGWATWLDRWEGYSLNPDESLIAEYRNIITSVARNPLEERVFHNSLSAVHSGDIDTWDFQFEFHSWLHGRSHLFPSSNLVSNIGFDEDATHTRSSRSALANAPVFPQTRVIIPDSLATDLDLDSFILHQTLLDSSFFQSLFDEVDLLRETCSERLQLIETLHEAADQLRNPSNNPAHDNDASYGLLTRAWRKITSGFRGDQKEP